LEVDVAPTSVVIVEPHLLVREGFSLILGAHPDFSVVGTADSVDAMVPLVNAEHPELLCVAAKFDDGTTVVDALERLLHVEGARPRVLLLTGKRDDEVVEVATRRGVVGVISKFSTPEDLVLAVRAAVRPDAAPAAR
jgi:DNA-binding NarL/FixJ family response regulator